MNWLEDWISNNPGWACIVILTLSLALIVTFLPS